MPSSGEKVELNMGHRAVGTYYLPHHGRYFALGLTAELSALVIRGVASEKAPAYVATMHLINIMKRPVSVILPTAAGMISCWARLLAYINDGGLHAVCHPAALDIV